MKKTLRAFNDLGISRFRYFLEQLRINGNLSVPFEYLEDTALTTSVDGFAEVDSNVIFSSRLDAGKYFSDVLKEINENEVENIGVWAWLSLFFFDQVCPKNAKGFMNPGQDYRYIPAKGFGKGAHRHLLKIPFIIYKLHGDNAKVLLVSKITKPGNINEEIVSRQKLITNPSIVSVLNELYYDKNENKVKKGIDDKKKILTKKGSLRRFVQIINQLELTYDIYSLTFDGLLDLLPEEFDVWLNN